MYKGIFASSVDPNELSLMVQGFSKALVGLVAWFAISKGLDPATATTQLQLLIDLIAQAIPVAFTFWNMIQGVWGALRKLLVFLGRR